MTRNRDIALLQISDAAEQVVASTDNAVGGENSIADDGRSLLQARDGQQVFSASSREDGQIMLFTTPISYQNHMNNRCFRHPVARMARSCCSPHRSATRTTISA